MEPIKDKLPLTLVKLEWYVVYAYLLYIVAALGHKAYGADVNPDTLGHETTTQEPNVHSLNQSKKDLLRLSSANSDQKRSTLGVLRSFPSLMIRDPLSFKADVVDRNLKEKKSMSRAVGGVGNEQFLYPNTFKLQPEPVPLIILMINF